MTPELQFAFHLSDSKEDLVGGNLGVTVHVMFPARKSTLRRNPKVRD